MSNRKTYISKKATIEKGAMIGKNVYIEDGVVIDSKSIVGNNCYVGKNAEVKKGGILRDSTHIGANTKIGYNADIEGFIMESVLLVHYCEINAMIGRKAEIGAGTFIGALKFNNKNPLFKIKRMRFTGETVYPCFIGNHTRTGIGTLTLPGVIIGNESAIYPGAIVRKNVGDNTLLSIKSKNKQKTGK
jgi:UDP-3-O-[3-hydroxymyristoyl] glucosamine N-acyltransferase